MLVVSCFCLPCFGLCPSSDLTGDCRVDFKDLALLVSQWLDEDTPEDMAWESVSDPGVPGHEVFDGEMSKYETTNAQYCKFLNDALASGDIAVRDGFVYGEYGSNSGRDYVGRLYFSPMDPYSQITYNESAFTVRNRDGHDMSNHPVVMVSWYGAMAFANYYGWRLPTEWEWQAVADYDGSFIYGCGATINHDKANYQGDNPFFLSSPPFTAVVGIYEAYGYGMYDMAGNVWEWTDSCAYPDCIPGDRIFRGGGWPVPGEGCNVSLGQAHEPEYMFYHLGFRVCR